MEILSSWWLLILASAAVIITLLTVLIIKWEVIDEKDGVYRSNLRHEMKIVNLYIKHAKAMFSFKGKYIESSFVQIVIRALYKKLQMRLPKNETTIAENNYVLEPLLPFSIYFPALKKRKKFIKALIESAYRFESVANEYHRKEISDLLNRELGEMK